MNFKGQVGVITGGGRGLGKAFAEALAAAGMHVVVTSRSPSELEAVVQGIEQIGGSASYFPIDVADPNAVRLLIAQVEQEFGPIELLINNAASLQAIGAVADINVDVWWREVEINLTLSPIIVPKQDLHLTYGR